jgi:hypothetical protein
MKKSATFQQERLLFFSTFLRFHAANIKEFCSICELLMLLNSLKKLTKKYFFLAIDAATQSSNKEANEKENFFFLLFKC